MGDHRPSDFLLFAPRTYYRVFELYNAEIWPLQIVALSVAYDPVLMRSRPAWGGRMIAALLAACCAWVAGLSLAALRDDQLGSRLFCGGLRVGALILIWIGVVRQRLRFDPTGVR